MCLAVNGVKKRFIVIITLPPPPMQTPPPPDISFQKHQTIPLANKCSKNNNKNIFLYEYMYWIREDTHKKVGFFSGRTTKGVGRINPTDH